MLLSVIAQQVTVNDALEIVPARSVNIEYYVLTGRIGRNILEQLTRRTTTTVGRQTATR